MTDGSPIKRIEYLDVFRGTAALLVFFYHSDVNIKIGGTAVYGYVGVHLFFVLSGFLLSRYFIGTERKFDLGDYARKRFMRIYPAYFVCLTIFVGLRFLTVTKEPQVGNIITHYLLIFNYFDEYDFYSINPVLWSLCIEAQFYVVLPIFFLIGARFTKNIFVVPLVMFAVGIVSRAIEAAYFPHVNSVTGTLVRFTWVTSYLDMFAIGMLLRVREVRVLRANATSRTMDWMTWVALFAPLICLWLMGYWGSHAGSWQESPSFWFVLLAPVFICLCFGSLLGIVVWNEVVQGFLSKLRFLSWAGMISYSLYLYHPGVYFFVWKVFKVEKHVSNWTMMTMINALIALPITLFIAWLGYKFIEAPCMNFRRNARKEIPVT